MRSPESPSVTQVVAALIIRDDLVLVAQRKSTDSGAGFWEFPGGKVEPGESQEEALVREIQEELEMTVEVFEKLGSQNILTPTQRPIELMLFVCKTLDQDFKLHEHQNAEWRHWSDLDGVNFLTGNRYFLPIIRRWFSSRV